jgi:hypothetical protein
MQLSCSCQAAYSQSGRRYQDGRCLVACALWGQSERVRERCIPFNLKFKQKRQVTVRLSLERRLGATIKSAGAAVRF